MIVKPRYKVGDTVRKDNSLSGVITRISVFITCDTEFVEYLIDNTWVQQEDLEYVNTPEPNTVTPRKTLYEALTDDSSSQAMILKNLSVILDTREQIERAERTLKECLNLKTGEIVQDDFVEVTKYDRTTMSYKGLKLYDDAEKEVDKAKEFLKLSKMGTAKTISIIVLRRK